MILFFIIITICWSSYISILTISPFIRFHTSSWFPPLFPSLIFECMNVPYVMFSDLLSERSIEEGSDLTVMVVNEGEIDLYLNFACSCHVHDISMNNVIVFAGSRWLKHSILHSPTMLYLLPAILTCMLPSSLPV